MRTISSDIITSSIREMCIQVNYELSPDMQAALNQAASSETDPVGREVLSQLQENLKIALNDKIPICQDTGMAVVFM